MYIPGLLTPSLCREQSTPSISICSQSFKVLCFNFLGLYLSCDGSVVCFIWSSLFPLSRWFPVPRLIGVCVGGILRTWPKYLHLLFNIVNLIGSAFTLSGTSSLMIHLLFLMFTSLYKHLVWKLVSFSSFFVFVLP